MQSQAKTLLAQIPGATLVQTALVTNVTLELGTDGLQVNGLGGATVDRVEPARRRPRTVTIGTGVPGVKNQPGCVD